MRKFGAVLIASVLAGCGSLQDKAPEEQRVVACAKRALENTPGVTDVRVVLPFSAFRTIIRYDYVNGSGRPAHANVIIEAWRGAGERVLNYTYRVNDGSIPDSIVGERDIRDLLDECGLGDSVQMGEPAGHLISN